MNTTSLACPQLARRWFLALAVVLSVVGLPIRSAAGAEQVDRLPAVAEFSSAYFDVLTTVEVGNVKQVMYGSGATIIPDRVRMWLGNNDNKELFYYVQIGSTIYINDGSGWTKTAGMPPSGGGPQNVTMAQQVAMLEQIANAMLMMGTAQVRGHATTHYQVWISGSRLLEASGNTMAPSDEIRDFLERTAYKLDLWIGQQDGLIHQQNLVLMMPEWEIGSTTLPASQLSTLITYYGFNDPNIRVDAPIM